jgi:hypothetical protein
MGRHPRPHGELDPYPIGGAKRGSEDSVVLRVWLRGFGPAAYCAIPRLFAHECVCHVPARQRGAVKNTSTFAEGYMDWVAGHLVRGWLPAIAPGFETAARFHGVAFMAELARARTDEAEARRIGTDAASELSTWFQKDAGLPFAVADATVAALGVELNLVNAGLEVKDRFVSRLQPHVHESLVEPLHAWLNDRMPAAELL